MPTRRGSRNSHAGWPWIPKGSIDGERAGERDLRSPEVSAAASKISAHAPLREVLLPVQRDAAEKARPGGAVVEVETSVPSSFLTLSLRFTYPLLQRSGASGLSDGQGGGVGSHKGCHSQARPPGLRAEISPLKPAADAVVSWTHLPEPRRSHSEGSRPRCGSSRENVRRAMLFEGGVSRAR